MENRLKMRISRMFRGSCRSRNLSDVIENAVFVPENHKNFHMTEPSPPKVRPFPSICRHKRPEETNQVLMNHSIISRKKSSHRYPPLITANTRGHSSCPPASPIFPFESILRRFEFQREKEDDDEEKRGDDSDTFFSSRSLSSDSSGSLSQPSRGKKLSSRRRRAKVKSSQVGVSPLDGKVKDSFAVVKSSSDPYNDFRTSMVEMIVEKQIFAAKDLEQLLQCFLSLNSYHHHRIIVEVFMEIWEALFSNWS
ncbi:OVATE PROTEIN FAMILY-RELATED [Salix purpurea]|uniref:Transcription repressor n=1 Tax=Salix purpurea TaxID=77065 RepID=A0A9Q0UK66_SALPP|nr:OVATE PROTEIN FAMILY-RELATED [Salix purpurea]